MKTAKLLPSIFVAAMLCAAGVSAQTNPAGIPSQYVQNTETIFQTKGKKMRLYVAPDPLYSPSAINAESRWRWEDGTAWAGSGAALKDWSNENWVEITPTANMNIHVKERFGAMGCESSDATTKNVVAVDAPTYTSIVVDNSSSEWLVSGSTYTKCQNTVDASVSVKLDGLSENGLTDDALKLYGLTYTVEYQTADNAGVWSSSVVVSNVANDVLQSFPLSINVAMKTNSGGAVVPTRYKIKFIENTLQSKISRVSDKRAFIADGGTDMSAVTYSTFTAPGAELEINIYPVPTTGPIYHIPNNF